MSKIEGQNKKELGIRAVETFPKLFPGNWEPRHARNAMGGRDHGKCVYCGKAYAKLLGGGWGKPRGECELQPVDINWDNAHTIKDAIIEMGLQDAWIEALEAIKARNEKHNEIPVDRWGMVIATPDDYIEAAIKAKENL